jgi:lipid-A-disaccharide synthase-like uncharacterized protein
MTRSIFIAAALLALAAISATTAIARAQEATTSPAPSAAPAADDAKLEQQLNACRAQVKDQQQQIVRQEEEITRLQAIAAKVGWPKTLTGQVWFVIGLLGEGVFFLRFVVQWWASERKKQTVVPMMFWHLSLAGTLVLLAYGIYLVNWVFILAFSLNIVIYVRNLSIARRKPVMEAVMEKESE